MSVISNSEIGRDVVADGIRTNFHDEGVGKPVLLIHGSGPGVSAWANWRPILPVLSRSRRVIAPDMVGFGFTERPEGIVYNLETWLRQILSFIDELGIEQADIVGNSFGGALSLALAIRHPDRVRRLVLMGSVGVQFEITEGLDAIWGYEPSISNMRRVMDFFAYDRGLVNDELAALRYRASIQPGVQEAFSSMFPAPRQRWVSSLASAEDDIARLPHPTLIVHGRDDRVIPLATSLRLHSLIEDSQLHVFGRCGHWTQIEHAARFSRLVEEFLDE
ncbi:alpha/beta hydrolase [Sphingobium aquiterrae]|jgi:2-hydroxymuconate-semialdehyde hydrolase|tara:strand:- start:1659 stop:2486 length:828 start_codon:yes stop_codon:yes gene_type:complete